MASVVFFFRRCSLVFPSHAQYQYNVNDVLLAAISEWHHKADRLQIYYHLAAGYASASQGSVSAAATFLAWLQILRGLVASRFITLLGRRFWNIFQLVTSHEWTFSGVLGTPSNFCSHRVGLQQPLPAVPFDVPNCSAASIPPLLRGTMSTLTPVKFYQVMPDDPLIPKNWRLSRHAFSLHEFWTKCKHTWLESPPNKHMNILL